MQIVSVNRLAKAINDLDPDSAINANMIRSLFADGMVRSWKHGNRAVCNVSEFMEDINKLFGFNEKETLPRVRAIHSAFLDLRNEAPNLGISEERIRFLVVKKRLPHIKMGNRAYIALESFQPPYDQCLVYDDYMDSKPAMLKSVVQEQLEEAMKRRETRKNNGGR